LKDGDGKSSCLSRARLRLGNNIVAFHDRNDSTLLNGRRTLKTAKKIHGRRHYIISVDHSPISIDSTKEFWLQVHVIKAKRAQ